MRLRPIFLVILLAFPAFSPMALCAVILSGNQDVTVQFERVLAKNPDDDYTFAIIHLRDSDQPVDAANQELAQKLLEKANDWNIDVYRERLTDLPPEKWEAMRRAGIHLTKNSSYLIAFKGTDPNHIVATMWAAYPDQSGKIDLENSLNWVFPRHPPLVALYPVMKLVDGKTQVSTEPVIEGGAIELKRFVMKRGLQHDLVPAMVLRAEVDGLLSKPIQEIPLKKLPRKLQSDYLAAGGRAHEGLVSILPREYALRTSSKHVRVYRSLYHFKQVGSEPVNGDYIMSVSRDGWIGFATQRLEKLQNEGWEFSFGHVNQVLSKDIAKNLSGSVPLRSCSDSIIRALTELVPDSTFSK